MKKARLKVNFNIKNKNIRVGDIVQIEIDTNGIPLDQFWRRRLKDSKLDNCVEIINSKKKINNVTE